MSQLKCPQCKRPITDPEILKNPQLLLHSPKPADPPLDICTTCWQDLPRPRISVAESPNVKSSITGTLLYTGAKEQETKDHPLPFFARKKRGQESPEETPSDTGKEERVIAAEKMLTQRPWELEIRGGNCRLFRGRLLEGDLRASALEAGLYPVVWEAVGPVVSVYRKSSLQQFLPPGLSLADIPEKRAKRGRRWQAQECAPSEWEQDRERYYRLCLEALALRGKQGGQEAAEAALLVARAELSRKYKFARQCRRCRNFIPRSSKALYCKPACKELAKARKR